MEKTPASTPDSTPVVNIHDSSTLPLADGKMASDNPLKKPSSPDGVALERRIGLFSAAMVILGNIIGSGIFLSPTGVYNNAGSVGMSMMVWTICGAFSTIGALCFAELGTTIESSGAEYSYIKEAFGDLWAFLVLWANLIIIVPTGQMIVALTCAYYIMEPFYPDPDCPPPVAFIRMAAVLIVGKFISGLKCILNNL